MREQVVADDQIDSAGKLTPDDERFLDAVLDRAVDMLHAGETPVASELVVERPHLLIEVKAQLEAARTIVPRAGGALPSIAGYTLLAEVGRGGMGAVYLARQDRLGGRRVALKVLAESFSLSSAARQRFRQESEAIARLQHAHIVGVHDVVEQPNPGVPPAFAMEWVDGRSLAAIIEHVKKGGEGAAARSASSVRIEDVRAILTGDAPENAANDAWPPTYILLICRVGIAIARALAAVHKAGLLHRDVKPSNILIRRDGVPLLTDFGLARDADGDATLVTQAGQFVGTPAYAPPEQLRGERDTIDARSDVYSLGVTLYHALALRLPFEGQGTTAVLRKIEAGRCMPLRALDRRIPRDLETIVAKAMEAEPGRRYQTAEEVAEDLERLLSLRPIRARRAGVVGRAWKSVRRNRRTLAGAIAGAGLVVALAATALLFGAVLPRVSDSELLQARLALLDPIYADHVMSTIQAGRVNPSNAPIVGQIANAIEHYDKAAEFAPWRAELTLERAAVRAAHAILESNVREIQRMQAALQSIAPITAEYLARLARGEAFDSTSIRRTGAADADLRAAGLLAYLVSDGRGAQEFWERLSLSKRSDPLVCALLTEFDFAERRWPLVYVRLQLARLGLEDVSYLTVNLADAAFELGAPEEARRWLEIAEAEAQRRPSHRDPFDVDKRVWAKYWAWKGEDAEAVRLYEYLRQSHRHPAAREGYARYLLSRGRYRDAAVVALEILAISDRPMYKRLFVESVTAWKRAADSARQGAWEHELAAMGEGACIAKLFDQVGSEITALPQLNPPLEVAPTRSGTDSTLPVALDWLRDEVEARCSGKQ